MGTSLYGVKRERVEETFTKPSRQKCNSMSFLLSKINSGGHELLKGLIRKRGSTWATLRSTQPTSTVTSRGFIVRKWRFNLKSKHRTDPSGIYRTRYRDYSLHGAAARALYKLQWTYPVLLTNIFKHLDNDQLDAHLLYFTIRPLHSSTCFRHSMLIVRRLNALLHHLVSSSQDDTRCCSNAISLLTMSIECLKHVEECNKRIVK